MNEWMSKQTNIWVITISHSRMLPLCLTGWRPWIHLQWRSLTADTAVLDCSPKALSSMAWNATWSSAEHEKAIVSCSSHASRLPNPRCEPIKIVLSIEICVCWLQVNKPQRGPLRMCHHLGEDHMLARRTLITIPKSSPNDFSTWYSWHWSGWLTNHKWAWCWKEIGDFWSEWHAQQHDESNHRLDEKSHWCQSAQSCRAKPHMSGISKTSVSPPDF